MAKRLRSFVSTSGNRVWRAPRVNIESFECRTLLAFDITANPFNAQTSSADNTAAINAAIVAAAASTTDKQVLVPAGQFKHTGRIELLGGVELMGVADYGGTGTRSELRATSADGQNIDIRMTGNGPKLRKLYVTSSYTSTQRLQSDSSVLVRADGASNFFIERVEVKGGASAGIKITNGANNGAVNSNKVLNCLADGIHNTHGAHHITVSNNNVSSTGDDLISVVSYDSTKSTFPACNAINIHTNNVNNTGKTTGRGITVVGGSSVTIHNNTITNAPNSGIYITTETAYSTLGINNITVTKNTINGANINRTGGHGGILIQGRNSTYKTTNVTVGHATDATLKNTVNDAVGGGIIVGHDTDTVKILRNTVNRPTGDGIRIGQARNVEVKNNTFQDTGEHGIHLQKDNTGTFVIASNSLVNINTKALSNIRAIWAEAPVAPNPQTYGSLSITGNSYTETNSALDVQFYIYTVGVVCTVSGNTTTTGENNQL